MEKTIDARGLMCPQPVIMAKRELRSMADGSLSVLVDNTTAVGNLRAYAEAEGFTAQSTAKGGDYTVTIIKTEESHRVAMRSNTVALFSSDKFGEGPDAGFGQTLLKNFLFALTEAESKPAALLFVNGGAYLTCAGSPALESLQALTEAGVEILTCGACLDFYGLKDTLTVGGVTNMYVIAEKLLGADKIIKL